MKILVTVFDAEKQFREGYTASKLKQEVVESDRLIILDEENHSVYLSDEFYEKCPELFLKEFVYKSWSPDFRYFNEHNIGLIDIYMWWK